MVRDDRTKVKIGDKEVEAKILDVELVQDYEEAEDPVEHGDKYKRETQVEFSLRIEDISEELKNWIIWGEPDPEIQSTQVEDHPSGDKIYEVDMAMDRESRSLPWICDHPEGCDELFDSEEEMEQHKEEDHQEEEDETSIADNLAHVLRDHERRIEDLEEVIEEFGAKDPEEKSIGEEVREKVFKNIDHYQEMHDSDPTTNEVADKIGEPLNRTSSWLNIMEAQGELTSYKLGASDLWRRAD